MVFEGLDMGKIRGSCIEDKNEGNYYFIDAHCFKLLPSDTQTGYARLAVKPSTSMNTSK